MIKSMGLAVLALPSLSCTMARSQVQNIGTGSKRLLVPRLTGDWWLIGPSPDLADRLPPAVELNLLPDLDSPEGRQFIANVERSGMSEASMKGALSAFRKYNANRNEPVDHHIFQSPDGKWHLWGCVRQTPVGRLLYHWQSDSITETPWTQTGEFIRCDPGAGECSPGGGEEVIMSPFFVHDQGMYYMYYGGAGVTADARDIFNFRTDGQICLMTSGDGKHWERHRNADGYSRVFAGPGGARDPCVIRIGDIWYMYYAGYEGDIFTKGGCFARTSHDLIHWSDYKLVHRDGTHGGGASFTHECPHVVHRDGYFYLFRTENYYDSLTHVYRSEDPLDFGIDTAEKFVTTIACAAPEIHTVGAVEYLSSNHDPALGTQLCRLSWTAA